MKQTILILTCLMLCYASGAQQKIQQYAVKSGYVEYELSGNTKGTKSIWWDNYGSLSRTETKSVSVSKVFGIITETKTHDILIMNGKQFWSANLIENTGQKGSLPCYQEMAQINENMSEAEKQKMGKDILEAFGGEIIGTENILGNKCEVVKLMGAKCWIYKGITLKSNAEMLGIKTTETAVKFEKNISISKSKFTPLGNITYEDQSQYQQQMFGGMHSNSFEDDDSDDEELDLIPVNYPYSKFEKLANEFDYNSYRKIMVMNSKGTYSAMFMKGMSETLAVAATSRKNGNPGQTGSLESFTHKGKKCMYGKMDDEDDISLIVDISNYDTYIVLVSNAAQTKSEMLSIFDQFNF